MFVLFVPVERAEAQWSVGASYEMRDEDPVNGLGVRVQREFRSVLPLVDLGFRGHFSYFSDEIDASDQSYTTEIENYDFGLAAFGGINIGLVKPYIGGGLGSESFEEVRSGVEELSFNENSFYWNLFAGAELSPIPVLKPFIEYRFTRLLDDEDFDYHQNGRLSIGVNIHF
ncbi:MAG: outer membrane beta-barrel protein [Balneolaceae bacterium]